MKTEIHIVIVWEKGLDKLNHILYDLRNNFQIIEVVRVKWSERYFSSNLSRFYGQNLSNKSFKERHCGKGPFTSIIIKDKNPLYANRKTSKGVNLVNSRLFDKKKIYRNWTGGGHKVHTSNDLSESSRDIWLLFNRTIKEYAANNEWDGKIKQYSEDILGAGGWKSFDSFFNFLNKSSEYVVLRNYQKIDSMNPVGDDIDFLTNDGNFCYNANAQKKHQSKSRSSYEIKVANQAYDIDIRYINDGYYDSRWASKIVSNRIRYDNFFIPNSEDEMYSLLYHSLIHKYEIEDVYIDRIKNIFNKISIDKYDGLIGKDRENLLMFLNFFLDQKGYLITNPKDYSVQYNQKKKGIKRLIWEFIGKLKNAI